MNVQSLSRTRAEAAAIRLWTHYGFRSPKDIELEVLSFARGALVKEGPLDTADARLVRKGKRGLIRVNQSIPEPGRKRFAIAHELGHFEIHAAQSQWSACTSKDMVASYKMSGLESEANWFAAELLMPRIHFQKEVNGAFPEFSLVKQLATYFETTITATAIRLTELSDERVAFVVSENGKVRYWRASDSFDEEYRLEPDMLLSPESAAGAICEGETPEGKSVRIEPTAWGGPEYEEDWWEDAFVLESYGQILSLIRAG